MMKTSMMDHYPAKKRRLVLNKKMSTRSASTNEQTSPSTKPKDECEGRITVKKSSPGNVSTDDSTVEIHWDNNSSSPSPALKNRRKQRKKRPNDLSTLIKQIPKIRKQENTDVVQASTTENAFTTWMQQNLASGPRRSSYSLRQNCTTTRPSGNRGSKEEALDFSEKVKQFLSQAPFEMGSQKLSQNSMRSSPTIVTRSSQRSQTSSPSYFSNSSADSLMMNFDNNLEDSIIAELDKVATSKTPIRSCRINKNRQTPKLTRSTRKRANRPVPKLSEGSSTITVKKPLPINNTETCEQNVCDKKTTNENKRLTEIVTRNNENLIDIEENDEIDEILSTQPHILQNNGDIEIGEVKMNLDDKISSMKIDRKKTSTPLQKNMKTLPKTPDLLIDNEADDFDDILANFDMGEIKCKSQETPARLTADQRKLKTKCHTSPLPLNNCYKERIDKSKTFIPISKSSDHPSSSNKLDNGIKTLSINSPLCGKKKGPLTDSQQSFIKTGMVTTACRKPFVPPKQHIFNNRFPLEMSAIEGRSGTGGNEPANSSISVSVSDSSTFNPFSSTQKCTMEEIEEKRKYAQMKLRERLRRKRSK